MIRTNQDVLYTLGQFITALSIIVPVFEINYAEAKKRVYLNSKLLFPAIHENNSYSI